MTGQAVNFIKWKFLYQTLTAVTGLYENKQCRLWRLSKGVIRYFRPIDKVGL